jgi:hypothetical protein
LKKKIYVLKKIRLLPPSQTYFPKSATSITLNAAELEMVSRPQKESGMGITPFECSLNTKLNAQMHNVQDSQTEPNGIIL